MNLEKNVRVGHFAGHQVKLLGGWAFLCVCVCVYFAPFDH